MLVCNQPFRTTQFPTYPQQDGKLVLAKKHWQCSAAGKVTVGLASHWPCLTDSEVSTTGSMP